MGRLHHLQRTIIPNLLNAEDCEFVIVNYNSNDGLHEWVGQNLRSWIDRGIVKYYRTKEPKFFFAAHAKNIAHRQATGDILCNIDADNFIIEGYKEFLLDVFKQKKCMVVSPSLDIFGNPGCCGKIAVLREHFYSVNGYDEDLTFGWCWEDTNLHYRAKHLNDLTSILTETKFCKTIKHYNEERYKNFENKNLQKSQQMGVNRLNEIMETKDYIANKNREWGYAKDLSSDI